MAKKQSGILWQEKGLVTEDGELPLCLKKLILTFVWNVIIYDVGPEYARLFLKTERVGGRGEGKNKSLRAKSHEKA